MAQRFDAWCVLAEATGLAPMKRFVGMLHRHRSGICNYANHRLTTTGEEPQGFYAIG